MDVTTIYALPVPVWVTCETLGGTYPTGYGKVRFDIVMPQDAPPTGAAPIVSGVEIPDPRDGELSQWTCKYGAFIPESLKPATTLQRVVVTNVEAPDDVTRSWNTADLQLAEVINDWFDRVRTWAEILTGQDLDPSHRVYDAEISGTGLTFIVPPHEGSLGMTLTAPSIRPVRPEEWQRILELVRDDTEPPLEELLSRDARPHTGEASTAARPSTPRQPLRWCCPAC
ncbi:hypothetical protein GCM10022234_22540 [Aeromicrobium panaciterrae]|uniref:hypothetical protein n=1 Tax=Aeromicrobium panaciterrae TaxID=363861 RepID=UPI0031D6C0CC